MNVCVERLITIDRTLLLLFYLFCLSISAAFLSFQIPALPDSSFFRPAAEFKMDAKENFDTNSKFTLVS